jgi:hypothetical protein
MAVLSGRELVEDDLEQISRQLDPSRSPRLGDRSSDKPCLPVLIEVTHLRGGDLTDTCPGRVERDQANQVGRGQQPSDRLNVIGVRRLDFLWFLERQLPPRPPFRAGRGRRSKSTTR